jgi:hypothetical protein|tara:strand:- start:512 stop:685 length:174 start_codon:yes stop_codon:yes gene_type:complete
MIDELIRTVSVCVALKDFVLGTDSYWDATHEVEEYITNGHEIEDDDGGGVIKLKDVA